MRKGLLFTAMLAAAVSSCSAPQAASPREALLSRLESYSDAGLVAYGHQDDLSYGHAWKVEDWENDPLERSDVRDATGHYPMLVGFDLGGIELGSEFNLDKVPFGLMRKAALAHIGRGGIVTFSWHPRNPLTGGDAWDISSDKVVESILPGGSLEGKFSEWLCRAADFIESLGPDVAVIMRPWHENVGSWFWWGGRLCTPEQYKALFRLTHDYFTVERGLDNILWCYSPNSNCSEQEFMERYPGDDCVDILGVDAYQSLPPEGLEVSRERYFAQVRASLAPLGRIAGERGKLLCLSETGFEGIPDACWWTQSLYPLLKEFPVSYVLTWRNAHDIPGHFYASWKGHESADDMRAFCEKDDILFLE